MDSEKRVLPPSSPQLEAEWSRLLDFYDPSVVDYSGGFHWLSTDGTPLPRTSKELWLTARITYCFALAELAGHPGARAHVKHGLSYLEGPLRDRQQGGWFASTAPHARKEAYGQAHVVLAAAASVRAGHAQAISILEQALAAAERFFELEHGLYADTADASWNALEQYRGANSNMHMVEALLAAGATIGDVSLNERAVGILDRILGQHAFQSGWHVPEHFNTQWVPIPEYNRDNPRNPFRPYGSTVGHWYEWARLSLQAWAATGSKDDRHVERAVSLYATAERDGRHPDGSLVFTLDPQGRPFDLDRYHWPLTEAIGAAEALLEVVPEPSLRANVNEFWSLAQRDFIDLEHGSWVHQLDPDGEPTATVWEGKPDLYHSLQATLFGRLPLASDLATALYKS